MVDGKLATVSLALGEGVACNSIFSYPFLQRINDSITTNNNDLISGLMGEKFNLEMMVPQRANEVPKKPEGLPVSLPVAMQENQNNTKDIFIMDSTVELKKTITHQRQIPGQN